MPRSKWKGPFFDNNYYQKLSVTTQRLRTQARGSIITESILGKTLFIHMGNGYRKCTITPDKIGFKIGDFSYTRKTFVPNPDKPLKSAKSAKAVKATKSGK